MVQYKKGTHHGSTIELMIGIAIGLKRYLVTRLQKHQDYQTF